MWRRLGAVFGLLLLTGCPYSEGCEGASSTPADPTNPESSQEDAGTTSDPDGADASDAAPPRRRSAAIDFGPEPTGAAAPIAFACPSLAMPLAGAASVVYVDGNARGTEETGRRDAPFRTLAKAFQAAPQAAAIWVTAGTYKETLVVPDKDLVVFGGFAPGFGSRSDACATVLEPANATDTVILVGREVVSFGLEGVTLQKAARGLAATGDETIEATVTLARTVFRSNGTKTSTGGGAELENVSARVFKSMFIDNIGSKGAALLYNGRRSITIDQSLFEHNLGYSDHGGGIYLTPKSATVTRNTFRGNATGVGINEGAGGGWGGAAIVDNDELDKPTRADFSYNVFTENCAGIGGGIFVDQGATLTMSHDILYKNRAYLEGIDTPDTFAGLRGAAIYADGTGLGPEGASTFVGEYLTVVDNAYDSLGRRRTNGTYGGNLYVEGFSKASVTNSIFWNNGNDAFYVESNSELSVTHSIGATSCTSSNAQGFIPASATICKIGAGVFLPSTMSFGDEATGDFHERSMAGRFSKGSWVVDAITSAGIDKANPASTVGSEPLPNGGRANLGAFGGTSEASKSP
ncbi:MAG: right-handed parallel beta-helix repeat-containing protein [Deltaproteobacteria bacterium]|nr:right-handed parallel beta-helix repeat-containing protein [Deltaproteobacteria bacterium]